MDSQDRQRALDTYLGDEKDLKIMRASAEIEHDFYCQATRVEETIRWAKKLGAKKIGIASCVGLLKESHLLAGLLREYGFEVYGVGCKIGEVPKTEVGNNKQTAADGLFEIAALVIKIIRIEFQHLCIQSIFVKFRVLLL